MTLWLFNKVTRAIGSVGEAVNGGREGGQIEEGSVTINFHSIILSVLYHRVHW